MMFAAIVFALNISETPITARAAARQSATPPSQRMPTAAIASTAMAVASEPDKAPAIHSSALPIDP